MNELSDTKLKRPMDKLAMGGDVAALNALLNIMNDPNITGAQVPKGAPVKAGEVMREVNVPHDKSGATLVTSDPVSQNTALGPTAQINNLQSTAPASVTPRNPQRIFYTGLTGAGKEYVAQQTGATILRTSDPLNHLAEYFFGSVTPDKTPGLQQFLQSAARWGRGEVSEQYPLTPARACFVSMIRSLGEASRFDPIYSVNWSEYGQNTDLWIEAVQRRVEQLTERVAISNVQSSNEFKKLSELGWTHFHVMCSPETRAKRGNKAPDASDALATALNSDVTKRISAQPRGAKLRVIWNDTAPAPSPRLYSVAEFLQSLNVSDSVNQTMIITGE